MDKTPLVPSPLLTSSLISFPFSASAYTEPYKVCSISAAPREDLTSDEEQGSSEEEDGALRDPSLTSKVGWPPGEGLGMWSSEMWRWRGDRRGSAPSLLHEMWRELMEAASLYWIQRLGHWAMGLQL
jgi:hypothetical protein